MKSVAELEDAQRSRKAYPFPPLACIRGPMDNGYLDVVAARQCRCKSCRSSQFYRKWAFGRKLA